MFNLLHTSCHVICEQISFVQLTTGLYFPKLMPCVEHDKTFLFLSSTVLCCTSIFLQLSMVRETCCPHFPQISFAGVLWSPSTIVAIQYPLYCFNACLFVITSVRVLNLISFQKNTFVKNVNVIFQF